jgi:NTE family protein
VTRSRSFTPPDVLVLGAGGVVGEAWLSGVLSGIEEQAGLDLRKVERFVGTSAGAIVAARLVAGHSPRRPDEADDEPGQSGDPAARGLATAARSAARGMSTYVWAAGSPALALGLAAAAPGGALVRAAILRRLPRPTANLDDLRRRVERWGPRWDGRLRVCAVEKNRGRRVVFGTPRAPRPSVADAVVASSTVPWLFAPKEIDGREYVDGAAWSPTNLDAAPAGARTEVLCVTPTGGAAIPSSLWKAIRTAGRTATEAEAAALRRRGANVHVLGPDKQAAEAMGDDFMSSETVAAALREGFRQGRALARNGRADSSRKRG